jgi:hypothetical protein
MLPGEAQWRVHASLDKGFSLLSEENNKKLGTK